MVVSDFNCPYCFTLNEWLCGMGLADQVRWVGVEHKPHLPHQFSEGNAPQDLSTLLNEVNDVSLRAPDLGVNLPPAWVNSRRALLLQASLEDEAPDLAPQVRQRLFRGFWCEGRNIASSEVIEACLEEVGVRFDHDPFLDEEELDQLTAWWSRELDRIPCMLAPTGARHLGLQDRQAVQAFVLGALQEPPPGLGCR